MSIQLYRHSTNKWGTVEARRSVQVLPSGKYAILTFDQNRSNAEFGDKSNIAKGYVHVVNKEGTTSELKYSFNVYAKAGAVLTSIQGAMAVDNSGNLHIAFNWHDNPPDEYPPNNLQSIRYVKLTNNGSDTFTAGSFETVYAHVNGEAIAAVDIDIPGSSVDMPMVAIAFTNWGLNKSYVSLHNRNSSTSWPKKDLLIVDGLYHQPNVHVACATDAGITDAPYVVAFTTVPYAADLGDHIFYGTVKVGGAFSATIGTWRSGLNKYQCNGRRELDVFYTGSNRFIIVGTVNLSPYRAYFASFQLLPNGTPQTIREPAVTYLGGYYAYNENITYSSWSMIRSGNDKGVLVSYHFDNYFAIADYFDYEFTAPRSLLITPRQSNMLLNQDGNRFGAAYPVAVFSGDHGRFATTKHVGCVIVYADPVYRFIFTHMNEPPVCYNFEPQDNATINTSSPYLSASVNSIGTENSIVKVQFQVALDANFASGLIEKLSDNFYWCGSGMEFRAKLSSGSLLQTTYYMRSRTVDILGNTSAWSQITKFRVSHQPSAYGLTPSDSTLVAWSDTDQTVKFSWKFSDSDKDDRQTASRISLKDSSGVEFANTGKVITSSGSDSIPVPVQYVEQVLRWDLTVWDKQDVSSDDIRQRSFYLARVPTVEIKYPVSTAKLNTAKPDIQWITTTYGGRTQVSYEVILRRASDDSIIYHLGMTNGSTQNLSLPSGVLRNYTKYNLTVSIIDSAGMKASQTLTFSTEWELPFLCPPPNVDTNVYRELGYAYVSAAFPDLSSYPNKDFVTEYIVWRRTYESGNEEWVKLVSAPPGGKKFLTVKDYMLPAGIPSEYVLTMNINVNGDFRAGDPQHSPSVIVNPGEADYWLIDKTHPELSLLLPHVTDDGWTDEWDQTDMYIEGRGRVVEMGDRIGNSGSLTAKLRDRQNGLPGRPVFNTVANSRFKTDGTGYAVPSWTAIQGPGSSIGFAEMPSYSACPTGRDGMLNFNARNTNPSAQPSGWIAQDIYRIIPRQSYTTSLWVEGSNSVSGDVVALRVDFYKGELDTGNLIGTYQQSLQFNIKPNGDMEAIDSNGEAATPVRRAFNPLYNWYRIDIQSVAPAGTVKAKVTIKIYNIRNLDFANINLGGCMTVDSTTPVRYFDGYSPDAEWVGEPDVDPSYTSGFYTARKMRQNIEKVKASRSEVYLRTPFGDFWRIQVGNMAIQRIPGVGGNEFVDVTIPYLELSDD